MRKKTTCFANMAYSRSEYINKAQAMLGGALIEWYKSRTGAANDLPDWTEHWRAEAERLVLREFAVLVAHPVKKKGLRNRRKALEQAFRELRDDDASRRGYARYVVAKDNGVPPRTLQLATDDDMDAFWGTVAEVVDSQLDEEGELLVPYE